MKKTRPKRCTTFVTLKLDLGVDLGRLTLEEAIIKARELSVTDVVDLSGVDYNDGSIEVTGVYTNDND